jgi:uncharacterized protein (TIGR03435 family)
MSRRPATPSTRITALACTERINPPRSAASRHPPDVRLSLSQSTRRTVIDRTGLDGTFDLRFEFLPDNDRPPGDTAADTGTPLFTALREQLGLRLEAARGLVEVFAIQSAERPTAN